MWERNFKISHWNEHYARARDQKSHLQFARARNIEITITNCESIVREHCARAFCESTSSKFPDHGTTGLREHFVRAQIQKLFFNIEKIIIARAEYDVKIFCECILREPDDFYLQEHCATARKCMSKIWICESTEQEREFKIFTGCESIVWEHNIKYYKKL